MGKRIAVVGGGAAGMMAAMCAAEGNQVTLYEKNEKLGKKLFITGKGRCNVTNACETEELFRNVVRNPRFLYSAFHKFDNAAVQAFFEAAGCPLKVERGERVFPVSDHSSDIIKALEKEMKTRGVKVCLHTAVREVLITKDGRDTVHGLLTGDGKAVDADAVILATGGLSYPSTGSTGGGFEIAGKLGHTVQPCRPSLAPFEINEEWCKMLQGLALKNVQASLIIEEKEIWQGFGEMLFTHFGVSGPLMLSASSYYGEALEKIIAKRAKKGGATADSLHCRLILNLKPALSAEQLDKRLLRDFEENRNRDFRNALSGLFPARLIPVMIQLSGIDPARKVHEITKEERREFGKLIRSVPFTVSKTRGFEEAIITKGGVSVREVNPSTMESKLVTGLYFAGEMLDVDALTGGYNLQIAWSTGYLAGSSAAV